MRHTKGGCDSFQSFQLVEWPNIAHQTAGTLVRHGANIPYEITVRARPVHSWAFSLDSTSDVNFSSPSTSLFSCRKTVGGHYKALLPNHKAAPTADTC